MNSQSEYLSPEEHLPRRALSDLLNNDDLKEVQVVHVVDPLFFFLKLRNEMDSYFILKQSIAIFYGPGGQGSCKKLSPHMLRPYSYTVVNYNGIWIRFLICAIIYSTQTVVGMSVDFGKALTLDMTEYDFYPLHRLFACLPPQAIHCSLFNVDLVKKKEWAIKGVELLNSMTGIDTKLSAIFVKTSDITVDTYEVVLVNQTNEKEPYFIAEKMLKVGCVKMKKQPRRSKKC